MRSSQTKIVNSLLTRGFVGGYLSPVLAYNGKINGGNCTYRGQPLESGGQISIFGSITLRGTSMEEAKKCFPIVRDPIKQGENIDKAISVHTHGSGSRFLSTSQNFVIPRFFALHFRTLSGAIMKFDTLLLSDCAKKAIDLDEDHLNENELTIIRHIPPCAVIGYQPTVLMFDARQPFVYNELYIDTHLLSPREKEEFDILYKKYIEEYNAIVTASNEHLPSSLSISEWVLYAGVCVKRMDEFSDLNGDFYTTLNKLLKSSNSENPRFNVDLVCKIMREKATPEREYKLEMEDKPATTLIKSTI